MIIDTVNKTIQLGNENLGEVVDQLQKSFPDTWKEFKVVPLQTVIPRDIVKEPVYREIPYVPYQPSTDPYFIPWQIDCGPTITYGDTTKFGTVYRSNKVGDFMNQYKFHSPDAEA